MTRNVVHIYTREIDFNLELDIEFLGIRMLTGTAKELMGENNHTEKKDSLHLAIIIQNQLESFESVTDGVEYSRPRLLIAFGVLSYFIQKIFTPFETYASSSYVGVFDKECKNKFIFEETDLIEDYNQFETIIKNHKDKEFIYSLLDRWRKGLYMETESEDNMIYDDETLLSYFHILELLTTKYEDKQKKELKDKIKDFSKSIFEESFLFEGNQLKSEINAKSKIIEGLLLPDLSVSSKIFYMFKEQGILTYRLKSFIANFVKDRNSVAHGRQVYQDRVIFPVPPFFPLIKNRDYPEEFYRILTAKAIANFIGVNLYSQEWDEISQSIIPSFDELREFQREKKYLELTNQDFCDGKENDITPFVVSHYLISKKLKDEEALEILTPFINKYNKTEDETMMSVWAIIIILDLLEGGELKAKCIEIIKVAEKNNWHPNYFKMRDEMYNLEYFGFEIKGLKDLIRKKEII